MANFPPSGPYGGPFNYQNQYAPPPPHPPPPSNVPYNMMQPPQFLQQRPPMYNPPLQNGHVQYANAAAFHNNTQYPPQHGLQHNMSIAPPPPEPQFFGYGHGQFGNTIPPPPFPPPPPAHSYHPQVTSSINHIPSPVHTVPVTTIPPRPSPPFVSSAQVDAHMVFPRVSANHSKEEGEVSEKDFERPGTEAHFVLNVSSRRDSPEAGEIALGSSHHDPNLRSLSSSVLGHHSTENVAIEPDVHNVVLQPVKEPSLSPAAKIAMNSNGVTKRDNTETREDPSLSENGASVQDLHSTRSEEPKHTSNNSAPNGLATIEQPGTFNTGGIITGRRKEKRELAKRALQELQSKNITGEQLLAEGVSLTVLQELYAELGTSLPGLLPRTAPPAPNLEAELSFTEKTSEGSNGIFSLAPQSLSNTTAPSKQKADFKTDKPATQGEAHGQRQINYLSATKDSSPAVTSVSTEENKVEAPVENRQQKKPSQIPPKKPTLSAPLNKPLDRKDYIAKLLAAKEAVKHTPSTPKTPKAPESEPEPLAEPVSTSLLAPPSTSAPPAPTTVLAALTTAVPATGHTDTPTSVPATVPTTSPVPVSARVSGPDPTIVAPSAPTIQSSLHLQPEDKFGSTAEAETKLPTLQPTVDQEPQPETRQMPEIKKPDAKDPVQTELVRRRLEALKKNTQLQQPLPVKPSEKDRVQSSNAQTRDLGAFVLPAEKPSVGFEVNNGSVSQPQDIGITTTSTQQYSPARPFFASSDRKAFSGLPGLSYLPPPPQSPVPITTSIAKPVVMEDAGPRESSVTSELSSRDSTNVQPAETEDQAPDAPAIAQAKSTQHPVAPVVPSIKTLETRKRATAADFIDSPPERTKRRLGSNGRIQLVIEVSDEEDLEDRNEDAEQPVEKMKPAPTERGSIGAKAFRDFPPLSNFPSRPGASSVMSTPPKAQNPKDLAQAEEEIRLVKQKIAELEQRKKSKNMASGVQTPAIPLRAESMPAASEMIEDRQQALEDTNQELVARQNSLAAATSVMQETLDSEKRTQAIVVAKVEDEREQAARATTSAERKLRLERKAALEAALPKLDLQIEAARIKLDDMQKQQKEIESEIQRGNEGRVALLDELGALLKSLETEMGDDVTVNEDSMGSHPINSPDSVQVIEIDEANSPPAHASELPESNASSHSTDLQPEVIVLSDSVADRQGPVQPDMLGDTMDISSSSADEGQILSPSRSVTPGPVPEEDITPPDDEDYEPPHDHELHSQEEYEPESFSPEPSLHLSQQADSDIEQVDMAMDEYEEYEPSLGEDISLAQAGSAPISIPSDSNDSEGNFAPASEPLAPPEEGNAQHPQDNDGTGTYSPPNSSMQEEGEVLEGSRSDPDDYEPPEPALSVDNDTAALEDDRFLDGLSPSQELDVMEIDTGSATPAEALRHRSEELYHEPCHGVEDSSQADEIKFGHYTPYESPLARFSSYRFHPQYVSEVPGGFRSLTYSHQIDPRKPLCRWELAGGICNDSSCEYQHFRDLPLTGNTILLQLGSVHEGTTTEEKQTYINGLKQTISGMRDRKVKDVSALASEIVAYRASFLGDSSRILTNV